MTKSKRIGYLFLCLVPLVIVICLQFLLSIPACGISALNVVLHNYNAHLSLQEMLAKIVSSFTTPTFTMALSLSYGVIALFIFGFWYYQRLAKTEEQVAVTDAFNPTIILSLALLAVGAQYLITYLMSIIGIIFPGWMEKYQSLIESAGIDHLSVILVIYACIVAPISEELIFRGVVCGYAKKALPLAAAICYQAVLFGVFHMNIVQGIYAGLFGLFLGYVREKGGSVAISILLHAIFNFIGTFLNNYLFYHMEQPFFFLLFLTIGVLSAFGGIFLFQHGIEVRDFELEYAKDL